MTEIRSQESGVAGVQELQNGKDFRSNDSTYITVAGLVICLL
jgi:hypothetical protein